MSNKTYDLLKDVALIGLPAITALYIAVAQIWGFPYAGQIAGTLTAVDTCLGALLKLSTSKLNGGKEDEQ